ncbi:MAG: DUF427 domain-containing protein [Bacteriovoracaceae bacterium]|nr:DUF427 domain-containing protein [Bacteriovoracaceae bacterium]
MTEHYADITTVDKNIEVKLGSSIISQSSQALKLIETYDGKQYPEIYYFPKDAINTPLTSSEHETNCPLKGKASYWDLEINGKTFKNAAWSYEDPNKEVEQIRGWVAFNLDEIGANLHI